MDFESLVATARANGASDLHLEPGLPAALRIRGTLRTAGAPIPGKVLLEAAQEIIGTADWPRFLERRSFDLSKNIQGVRCRINILHSARGVGLAVRLLAAFTATLEKLNLHPDLRRLIGHSTGLILISGPTGCGKSSTMAALIQEINLVETRHIVTIESPIEYLFKPHHAFIRQREVGRDTPSFEQALIDAMREDPDVLMVGEMRDPETMRLTLNAAETGHLVLATTHSATATEAVQRIVSAFPSEIQNGVCAQLADCLVAVVSQRLVYREELGIQLPECEVLLPTHAIKNFIRRGELFKVLSVMETGAEQGMWTFQRYRTWMENKRNWHVPPRGGTGGEDDTPVVEESKAEMPLEWAAAPAPTAKASPTSAAPKSKEGRMEIEPEEGGLEAIISKLKSKP